MNDDIRPYPSWLPSIYHLIKVKTTLRYYGNFERTTTLSELTVELNLPFLLYPFRKRIQDVIEKVKILKDLEDVALFDRRAKLFGRDSNEVYLKRHQFLLHKEDYVKYFSESCSFLGEPAEVQKNETWTNIKNLDRDYVKKFLKEDYHEYTNFENDELAGIIPWTCSRYAPYQAALAWEEEVVMSVQLVQQAQEILGQSDLVILTDVSMIWPCYRPDGQDGFCRRSWTCISFH